MIIDRFKQNDIGTWGRLFSNGFECFTFEPVGADEVRSGLDKRIPQGFYNIRWHNSPKFGKKLPHLYNDKVPKNRYILIHSGNYANDTEGCILLGFSMGENGVFNSRQALDEFLYYLRYLDLEKESLLIRNCFKG